MTQHLAQLNIARLTHPIDALETQGFVDELAPINALADDAPGFVWRLQTDDGDATAIRAFDDDMLIVNLSVWQSVEALRTFAYSGRHRDVMRQRRQWFDRMQDVYLVLWWVTTGHEPTTDEAQDRLERLRREGPTPAALTLRHAFTPGGVPVAADSE
jgi:hypothetical protein